MTPFMWVILGIILVGGLIIAIFGKHQDDP